MNFLPSFLAGIVSAAALVGCGGEPKAPHEHPGDAPSHHDGEPQDSTHPHTHTGIQEGPGPIRLSVQTRIGGHQKFVPFLVPVGS